LPAGTNASEPYGIETNGSNTLVVSDANNARAFVYTLSSTSPYATLDYTLTLTSSAVPDGVADMSVAGTNLAFIGNESGNSVTVIDPPLPSTQPSDPGTPALPVTVGTSTGPPVGTAEPPILAAKSGDALAPPPAKAHKASKKKKHMAKKRKAKKDKRRRARRHAKRGGGR
jgi:hypothetical protein